jgi:hypothetical protein
MKFPQIHLLLLVLLLSAATPSPAVGQMETPPAVEQEKTPLAIVNVP